MTNAVTADLNYLQGNVGGDFTWINPAVEIADSLDEYFDTLAVVDTILSSLTDANIPNTITINESSDVDPSGTKIAAALALRNHNWTSANDSNVLVDDPDGDSQLVVTDDDAGNVTLDIGSGQTSLTIGALGTTTIDTADALIVDTDTLIVNDDVNILADGIQDSSVVNTITASNYEPLLANEAGLYSALSDVSNFLQTGDALAGDDITDGSVDASELATDAVGDDELNYDVGITDLGSDDDVDVDTTIIATKQYVRDSGATVTSTENMTNYGDLYVTGRIKTVNQLFDYPYQPIMKYPYQLAKICAQDLIKTTADSFKVIHAKFIKSDEPYGVDVGDTVRFGWNGANEYDSIVVTEENKRPIIGGVSPYPPPGDASYEDPITVWAEGINTPYERP